MARGSAVAGGDTSSMPIYQTRWSAKQLREIGNAIKGKKRDVISKSSFGDLLYISPLVPPPEGLLDFIVMRIDTKKRVLKINDHKEIHFTRDMVKKIFNVPSGSRPLEFGKRGKADFREVYLDGDRAPIANTAAVISKADDDDEETIERSWTLLCLALVLAPKTGNMVPLEYLYTLRDMSVVHELEFDEHILFDVMGEVKKYQDKRDAGKTKFLIGGCLPMLPIIYMDHLDVPRGCLVDHTINYSLPRACFVQEMDFYAVIAVDALDDGFGKRPFSKSTPYAATEFISYIDQQAQGTVREEPPEISDQGGAVAGATHTLDVPEISHMQSNVQVGGNAGSRDPPHAGNEGTKGSAEHVHEPPPSNTDGGDDVCGSLEEWLHALPTFEELELPPHLQVIYSKHKDLYATDLNAALRSFGMVLQGMYCKRMGLMLSEAHKAECSFHEQKDEGEDVTFSVPGGASTEGMSDATAAATEPSPPPQQCNIHPEAHGAAGMDDAPTTEPCLQQPKQPDGEKSSEPVLEVGHNNAAPPKMSDHSNGKGNGEDLCSKVNNTEQKSPRSPGFPSVNLTRRPCTLEDGPSFGLFEPGSDDDLLFREVSEVRFSPGQPSGSDLDSFFAIRARSPLFEESPTTSAGPVFDVTPLATCPPVSTGPAEACVNEAREEVVVEVSSGRSHVGKKAKLKRAATMPEAAPKLKKMKNIKVDATDDAIYKQYCCTHYQIKDPPEGEPLPPFIRIGGFEISFKHFSRGLKKRAHLNNEVMSLYVESFNIENMYSSSKPKKFAFSPHMASKLAVDPSSFQTRSCIKDFDRACDRNNIAKCDQLFLMLVKDGHWAVVVVNLMQKQFNVFDSNSNDPEYASILEQPCRNLIANFKTLVKERNPWKHDLDTFVRFSPDGCPQQSTTFDCGIFAILYMENLTARGMKPFKTDTRSLLNFRTFVAAKLFKHPQNTLDSAYEFKKLLRRS